MFVVKKKDRMMWELGNFWTERVNSAPMPTVHPMVHEIHVLLVDHDPETLIHTVNQLQMCQCRVSYVDVAIAAIPMLLSHEKAKFDVVMANINSHDPNGYKLLQHALNMCIPVVWMSDDDTTSMAMRALENGAFICIKKPPPMEFLKCLWQHVIREKTRMLRERDMFVATNNLGPARGVEFRDVLHPNPNPNFMMMKNKGKHRNKCRGRYDDYDDDYNPETNIISQNGSVRRKMCTEWTQELHAKFMNAVEQLGEGRCFPKEILEMMNEPGLTRMQVASHLQKCRNDNWRSPEERKPTNQQSTGQQSLTPNTIKSQSKIRKFGQMPLPNKPSTSQIHIKTGQSSEAHWEAQTPKVGPQHYGTNDYFNFPDMDSLIRDFSGRQQEPEINNPTQPQDRSYQVGSTYNDDQNSGEASMKTKNHD